MAEDGAALSQPDGVVALDAGGRTLMPGLIDAHVHTVITTLDLAAMARRSPTRVGIEAKAILERMLRRGFTTVRDAGGLDAGIKEALQRLIRGPRLFRSGRVLSQTGGHGDITPPSNDPVLVDGDPLADIGVLGGQGDHLDLIVRAGEIVKNNLN